MSWKIPLFKIYWDEEDVEAVTRVIKSGMNWSIGDEIEQFERTVAEYLGRKYAVTFNSGTSALHATLLAFRVRPKDEVIVPSFTFIATANSPLFVGARPVFADIEEETYGLDPCSINEKITKKSKMLIPIHYGGLPCQIEAIKEIAEDHNLIVIEDSAEALGATINNKKVGSFGDAAILSFCQNKIITTGEGGMVVTDLPEICERLKQIRSHGRLETEPYFTTAKALDYVNLGYNWRMSSITASLGISQMKKLDHMIEMRRGKARYLTTKLSKIHGIKPPSPEESCSHIYQMYTVAVEDGRNTRDGLKSHLAAKGVMSKVYFDPVHLTRFCKERFGYKEGELPVTERLAKKVLTLPMYPALSEKEIDYACQTISEFTKEL